MQTNKELELALNYVKNTNVNVFLTGRAGTGKTTFLKNLSQRISKRYVVVAPTGVAALQAGGVTIHSFFQLPLHVYVPGTEPQTRKFSKHKINLIRSLDLLVIDEISMVRADILDEIDYLLRRFRYNAFDKPFGGIQLLLIGDINQLPPIVTENDNHILRNYYKDFHFFSSIALQKSQYVTITLQVIYRQTDNKFINILNAVRDNNLSQDIIKQLNSRYQPKILDNIPENYIVLCTHNHQADSINNKKLSNLQTKEKTYKATIQGDFPETIYPNNELLTLKEGAQVMFLKNDYVGDTTGKKRYYNGKIVRIKALEEDKIIVQSEDSDDLIEVEQYTWENVQYSINKEDKSIKQNVNGTFTQFPLKLAWAVTIHKSQGLTFDKVIINSNHAFSHGQVYVALSRCRTLEGLILSEPFNVSSVIMDDTVASFTTSQQEKAPNQDTLKKAKNDFYISCIAAVFDFEELDKQIEKFSQFIHSSMDKVFPKLTQRLTVDINNYRNNIALVGKKFNHFIYTTYEKNLPYEEKNEIIIQRALKGKDFFLKELEIVNEIILSVINLELDSQDDNESLNEIITQISINKELKHRIISDFDEKFSISNYLHLRNNLLAQGANLPLKSIPVEKSDIEDNSQEDNEQNTLKRKKSSTKSNKSSQDEDIKDKDLFEILRIWRKDKADENGWPAYVVLSQKALIALANEKPRLKKDLLSIHGIGKKKVEDYGEEILKIIDDYLS